MTRHKFSQIHSSLQSPSRVGKECGKSLEQENISRKLYNPCKGGYWIVKIGNFGLLSTAQKILVRNWTASIMQIHPPSTSPVQICWSWVVGNACSCSGQILLPIFDKYCMSLSMDGRFCWEFELHPKCKCTYPSIWDSTSTSSAVQPCNMHLIYAITDLWCGISRYEYKRYQYLIMDSRFLRSRDI